jgi:hypothetical protein
MPGPTNAKMTFRKPLTAGDLELVREAGPRVGEEVSVPSAYYPEALYRLKLAVKDVCDLYCDEPEVVAESTRLFWDPCTNAQILLWAETEDHRWCLSLTCFGALRWELTDKKSEEKLRELESQPLAHLLDVESEFSVGVTLGPRSSAVRLLAGQADGMVVEEEAGDLPEDLVSLVDFVVPGCGPDAYRPFHGKVIELLVANTFRYQLYDHAEVCAAIDASFPGGGALATHYTGETCVELFPGPGFAATSGPWYHFCVRDNDVRSVVLNDINGMNEAFFVSKDQRDWQPIRSFSLGKNSEGRRRVRIDLPERSQPLYLASSIVYSEAVRDSDIAKARQLGAEVTTVAHSTLGLPVHVVALTDRSTPLEGKKGVVLLCGQHSPLEEAGGFLGTPCVEELVQIDKSSGALKDLAFYWVPIFNVDCNHYGAEGTDARVTNPNRCWTDNRGPEHIGLQAFLMEQDAQGVDFRFMLDVHMGAWRNHTLLPFYETEAGEELDVQNLTGLNAEKEQFVKLFKDVCGIREVWCNTQPSTALTHAPAWFQHALGGNGMTIEGNVSTYFDPIRKKTLPFSMNSFEELGRNLAKVFAHEMVIG